MSKRENRDALIPADSSMIFTNMLGQVMIAGHGGIDLLTDPLLLPLFNEQQAMNDEKPRE